MAGLKFNDKTLPGGRRAANFNYQPKIRLRSQAGRQAGPTQDGRPTPLSQSCLPVTSLGPAVCGTNFGACPPGREWGSHSLNGKRLSNPRASFAQRPGPSENAPALYPVSSGPTRAPDSTVSLLVLRFPAPTPEFPSPLPSQT